MIDLPHPAYTTRAPDGWTAVDLLWANGRDGDAHELRAFRTSWVGWRWDELDGATYRGGDRGRSRSDDWLAWDVGEQTTWMVHRGGGLVPGRCPIAGTPRRLIAPAP